VVYPVTFQRLVLGGSISTERWNTSVAFYGADQVAVTSALLAAVASNVSAWFTSAGANAPLFTANVALTDIKLNRIGPDGTYVDPTSMTHEYPAPIVGTGGGTSAPQLAGVVTLRTDFARGLAHAGRMYLPTPSGFAAPAADGMVTTAVAIRVANSVATLLNTISATMATEGGGGDFHGHPAVLSDRGAGAWHFVTSIQSGRVVDTMRSRRTSIPEDYQDATVAIVEGA
jgi:hypothetical protein